MSSINGISGSGFNLNQIGLYRSTSQQDDNRGIGIGRGSGGGRFANALVQALSQIGVSTPSSSTSSGTSSSSSTSTATDGTTTSTQDPQQALSAFMHDLFAALQAQGTTAGNQATSGTDSDGDSDGSSATDTSGASGKGHRYHGGGLNATQDKLQSLIQQLSSSSSTSSTGTIDPTTTGLQQDFQNLLTSLGATGNQTSLASFLQTISSNLHGNNPGLNVSTSA